MSNSLAGYTEFISLYSIVKRVYEKQRLRSELDPVENVSFHEKLFNARSDAQETIKGLLLTQNNNADLLIHHVKNDCFVISTWLDNVIEQNPVLAKAKGLTDEETQTYFDSLDGKGKIEVQLYSYISEPFYQFYAWFLKIISPRLSDEERLLGHNNGYQLNQVASKARDIPEDVLDNIHKQLVSQNYLSDGGEKTKVKPVIAVLLRELGKKFGISKSGVLKQVAQRWNLTSDETKNFKLSKSKEKLQKYEGIVNSILKATSN